MTPNFLLALAIIWIAATVGAVLLATPMIYVAAVVSTVVLAIWGCCL